MTVDEVDETPFATLTFRGKRFESNEMPIEVLSDLVAYRELLVVVARHLFREANPHRRRLAKNFDADFVLVLGKIGEGSTISPILRRDPSPGVNSALFADYFEQARTEVEAYLASPSTGIARHRLPDEALGRFAAFGRGLRDDEEVEIRSPGSQGVVYSKVARRNLLLATESRYEEDVEIEGLVREVDKDKEQCKLKPDDGGRITVSFPSMLLPQTFSSLVEDQRISVRGVGTFNKDGLQSIQAEEVVPTAAATPPESCPITLQDQVQTLANLRAGWYNGSGSAYSVESLRGLRGLLEGLTDAFRLPRPFVYPNPDGRVRVEWSLGAWEVSGDFDIEAGSVQLLAVEMEGDSEAAEELNLRTAGSETRLAAFLTARYPRTDKR